MGLNELKQQLKKVQSITDSLKITINGSFGKFSSKFSILFSPLLLVQTTITGQLSLLMLIESIEEAGFPVISANTDGIVVKMLKSDEHLVDAIVEDWELCTGFVMEDNEYSGLFSRDVNSYIALKVNSETKPKGAFAPTSLSVSPSSEICSIAIQEFIKHGTRLCQTIKKCDDVRKFVTVRAVTGGAVYGDEYVGKTVRWYYSTESKGQLNYKKSGNLVPKSTGAKPLMEYPDDLKVPVDLDYEYYINETIERIETLGIEYER